MVAELSRGKNLQQAFELMIKNKAFNGSKAYITFIRQGVMELRELTRLTFQETLSKVDNIRSYMASSNY